MMETYHKIQTVFKRDPFTKYQTLTNEYALPEFEYLKDNIWQFTEKVDGTNIRIIIPPTGIVEFRGKTDRAQIPARLIKRLEEMFFPLAQGVPGNRPFQNKLAKQFPDGGCLYGEGYGAKIQKGGGNYSETQEFVLFDVRVGGWWLERFNVENVAMLLGIVTVPVIGEGTLKDMVTIVKGGFASTRGNFQAEGIVARPKVELFNRNNKRIITKLKCKDFKQ